MISGELHRLIVNKEWDAALQLVGKDPAATKELKNDDFPLHVACENQAPNELILEIMRNNVDAVKQIGVGTHVAPIFFGAIELSSIPLQIVDLFHPNKSPHWNEYVNRSPSTFFPKLCSTSNDISRILFAVLFLLVRGLYFPFVVVRIAIPDFYAEGSLPSTVLMVMCVLFTLLQMYWATLVAGQVKKALSSGGGSEAGGGDGSN